MFERFTQQAREVVVRAQDVARRLDHPAIGTSHLLLALLTADDATARLLRERGVTEEDAERALRRVLRRDPIAPAGGPAPDEDAAALAALGFDLDRIRAAVEAAFGPGALEATAPDPAPRGLRRLVRRSRRPAEPEVVLLRGPGGAGRGHIPFGRDARKALELSLREALRLGDGFIGTEHVLLGLLRGGDTVAAGILAELGVEPAGLRRAVEERRRRSA
ncbi:Clp protease N-terminal domain-containing protein [Kineosporia sp. A_224]|uniref:Clp protease N-terminal domain-containing protein n=1 Tax=Kineosporia sp. A_224 TaxID=1962180 RepID=UPI000B4A5BFF|nr:Clp protease N-terminal domain-containing protein [Kineosporia sp. A_224]